MCRNCHYFCIVHFKVCRFPHGCADMQRWTYLSSRLNKLFQFWILRLIQSLSIKDNINTIAFLAQTKTLPISRYKNNNFGLSAKVRSEKYHYSLFQIEFSQINHKFRKLADMKHSVQWAACWSSLFLGSLQC